MITNQGRQLMADRVTGKQLTKPASVRIEQCGGGIVLHDGKPKKDKTRFASLPLVYGDELTIDLNGVKVYCFTKKPYTAADRYQLKLKFAALLTGSLPFVSKKRLRELMKDV